MPLYRFLKSHKYFIEKCIVYSTDCLNLIKYNRYLSKTEYKFAEYTENVEA